MRDRRDPVTEREASWFWLGAIMGLSAGAFLVLVIERLLP